MEASCNLCWLLQLVLALVIHASSGVVILLCTSMLVRALLTTKINGRLITLSKRCESIFRLEHPF